MSRDEGEERKGVKFKGRCEGEGLTCLCEVEGGMDVGERNNR